MNTSLLQTEVILHGRDLFNRRTRLILSPNPNSLEWVLCTDDGSETKIRPAIAHTKNQRMVLEINGTQVNISEHILATRFANVLGVSLSPIVWPPYHGRAL